jgi:hypothetical protein
MEISVVPTGLPDLSWYNIPKAGCNVPNDHKIYQMDITSTKCSKVFQMAIKYSKIFSSKALKNLPKLGFLMCK